MKDLYAYLKERTYPGRGIVIGMNQNGLVQTAYWIMGRSVNSRNRVFVKTEDGIRTQAADPSKMSDPSLIIYAPVRKVQDALVVTNGDQTDTIRDDLTAGKSFEDALRTRTFEPDGPNWTPRISGIERKEGYSLSILKSFDGDGKHALRQFFDYEWINGNGSLITTYQDNGNPLPSFEGEPVSVRMNDDFEQFGEKVWASLDSDNKVSLYVRQSTLDGSDVQEKIFNVNGGR